MTGPVTFPLAGTVVTITPGSPDDPSFCIHSATGEARPMWLTLASRCTAAELRTIADHLDTLFAGTPE